MLPPSLSVTKKTFQIARIEGYAAIFDTPDQSGDSIDRRAFEKYFMGIVIPTSSGRVSMLYQHKVDCPLGCWQTFKADAKGLFVTGILLLDAPQSKEIHALLQGGALNGLSIGFKTRTAQKRRDGGRHITQADLWEVSIVTFPMADGARITHVGDREFISDQNPERAGLSTQTARRAPFVPSGARQFSAQVSDALNGASAILSR